MMRPLTHATGVDGLTLRGGRWGPDHGRPVVILHGYLEQGAAWHEVAEALDRRVVAPDHRGHGLSDHVGPGGFYHFWDYIADAVSLVTSFTGPVDLVGHSMGGTIASLVAALRPECVRTLTLIEGLGPPDLTDHVVERAERYLQHMAAPPKHPCFPDVGAAATRMKRFQPYLSDATARRLAARIVRAVRADDPDVREPIVGQLTWSWDRRHRMAAPFAFRADTHMRFLTRIDAPTCVITGGASPFRVDDHDARFRCLSNARAVTLDDAGHNPHLQCPARLADVLQEHLDGHA